MAKVFLDTNIFVDAIHRRPERETLDSLEGLTIMISPLSVHIFCYSFHIRVPSSQLQNQLEKFNFIKFDYGIIKKAMTGPTPDLEDNIQLHSAAEADCDYFLTNDKKLLKMKFFGKTQITNKI